MLHYRRVRDLFSLLFGYRFVTVIGAGGKTTFIESAAKDFRDKGFSTVITTTTKIRAEEPYVLETQLTEDFLSSRPLVRVGGEIREGKLHSISEGGLTRLASFYDLILIEGDGAKGRPLKYPADYEPVIPDVTDFVLVICGLDGLDKKVEEAVFRWELLREKEGFEGKTVVDEGKFVSIVSKGMLKGTWGRRYAICLNKYDAIREKTKIRLISQTLAEITGSDFLLISSLKYRVFYTLDGSTL